MARGEAAVELVLRLPRGDLELRAKVRQVGAQAAAEVPPPDLIELPARVAVNQRVDGAELLCHLEDCVVERAERRVAGVGPRELGDVPRDRTALGLGGIDYLSNATSSIRPRLFSACFVVSTH